MTPPPDSPDSRFKESISDISDQIQAIIDEAESAATEIRVNARADANRESQRILSQHVGELRQAMAPVAARVEALSREAGALLDEIDAVETRLSELRDEVPAPARTASPQPGALSKKPDVASSSPATASEGNAGSPDQRERTGSAPVAYPGSASKSGESTKSPPQEAFLRATQMAVAGQSRDEIEATLASEFGLDDPASVAEDILGQD